MAAPCAIEGAGLHTGVAAGLRFLPAPVDAGVVFRRVDVDGAPQIAAVLENVHGTERSTTLAAGGVHIQTVEHVLSAVAALQIDNLVIEATASEVPMLDGSASPFERLLLAAGIEEQSAPARFLNVPKAFSFSDGDSSYAASPAADYRISTTIEFPHPLIGHQAGSFLVSPPEYSRELAPARTFGFLREVEELQRRGLVLGGSLENAVVLTESGIEGGRELRFPDEFVRHKTLDLVGDLALTGARIRAHIAAERPSHRGNIGLARQLRARAERTSSTQPPMDIQQILQHLPHRYPFLLVDRILEYEAGRRIVGLKNVTINEPFFVGHFPGHPIMPGVLIIEAMAQVGGLLVMEQVENPKDKVVYFMSLDNVKWRRPVVPGDQIRFELELLQVRRQTCRMRGVGTVDGQVVAEAEMMARVVDR